MAEKDSSDIEDKISKFLENKNVNLKDQYLIHMGMAQDLLQEIRDPESDADPENDELDELEESPDDPEPETVTKPPKVTKKAGGTRKIGRPKKKPVDEDDF